ncbi:MAG TPA: hypothetical protein VJ552_13145 [Sediminibacterium sp.]|nr:hypothetical protein [Sediminibacterium sp.]
MKKIFVNEIIDNGTTVQGLAVLNHTVLTALKDMYERTHLDKIMFLAQQAGQPIYFFDRYCQYIVFVQISIIGVGFEGALSMIDCKGDYDTALDQYLEYQKNGWDVGDRTKFMQKFEEIINDKSGIQAELVVKDAVR